jgi:HTH-type transcriptional regulator/antitoxin HipB
MDYPIQSPTQLSSQLRALRKARGLSQTELGAMLGVGQTRVTRIEHDPTAISVEQFLALLNALSVQMVLRPTPARPAPARATAKSRHKTRPDDEPW